MVLSELLRGAQRWEPTIPQIETNRMIQSLNVANTRYLLMKVRTVGASIIPNVKIIATKLVLPI